MNPDLDTLATRLYVTIDDLLIEHPQWAPERPTVGITPKLTDAELLTLAVLQALLGFTSEARFIRHAHAHLRPWFPYLPDRPGYNKRLRHSGELFQHVIASLARACPSFNDDLWLVDSTPVECGRSRETAKRSDLAGTTRLISIAWWTGSSAAPCGSVPESASSHSGESVASEGDGWTPHQQPQTAQQPKETT